MSHIGQMTFMTFMTCMTYTTFNTVTKYQTPISCALFRWWILRRSIKK